MIRGRELERMIGLVLVVANLMWFVVLLALAIVHAGEGVTPALAGLVVAWVIAASVSISAGAQLWDGD